MIYTMDTNNNIIAKVKASRNKSTRFENHCRQRPNQLFTKQCILIRKSVRNRMGPVIHSMVHDVHK